MTIKIDSKPAKGAADALGQYGNAMYATLGKRIVIIAELEASERNDVADDSDTKKWVKLKITSLEVANPDNEDVVRQAMQALNVQRTAFGTLTEDEDVELSAGVLERCAGEIPLIEAARLHTAIEIYGDKIRAAARNPKLNNADLRKTVTDLSGSLLAQIYPNMLPVDTRDTFEAVD